VSSIQLSSEVITHPEDQERLKGLQNHGTRLLRPHRPSVILGKVERVFEQLYDSGHTEMSNFLALAYLEPAADGIEEFHAWVRFASPRLVKLSSPLVQRGASRACQGYPGMEQVAAVRAGHVDQGGRGQPIGLLRILREA
jgi:hypothetical protein